MAEAALIRSGLSTHPEHKDYLRLLRRASERWFVHRRLIDLTGHLSPSFWIMPAIVETLDAACSSSSPAAMAARALLAEHPVSAN
eukprot:8816745-Pyramimonas_sp.AAC.1